MPRRLSVWFAIVVTLSAAPLDAQQSDTLQTPRDTARVATARTVAELLLGRVPGVLVYPSSGMAGAGARIRIRGLGSLMLSNEPAVYVDGIRVEGAETDYLPGVPGQRPSRLDDFNPEDIDSIVVVRGPAAGVTYGPEVANGIIQLYTKQAGSGGARWRAFVEQGRVFDGTPWPANYGGVDADSPDSVYRVGACTLQAEATGLCQQDYVQRFAPLVQRGQFRTAPMDRYGLTVRGALGRAQYALAGDLQGEGGVYELSRDEAARLISLGGPGAMREEVRHPSDFGHTAFHGSIAVPLPRRTTATVTLSQVSGDARFAPEGSLGLLFNGLAGRSDSTVNDGWRYYHPGELFQVLTSRGVDRLTASARLSSQPVPFVTVNARVGVDAVGQHDVRRQRGGEGPQPGGVNPATAYLQKAAADIDTWTLGIDASAHWRLGAAVARTRTGIEHVRRNVRASEFNAAIYDPDGTGPDTLFASREAWSHANKVAGYLEQQLQWHDRLFITGGLRVDDVEATTPLFQTFYILPPVPLLELPFVDNGARIHPALAVSWLPVATPRALLDRLELSLAYGRASRRVGRLGPEWTTEAELGAAVSLWRERVRLETRAYSRALTDGLLSQYVSYSTGYGPSILINGARVSNRGLEVTLAAAPLARANVAWDLAVTAWGNRNRLNKLPGPPTRGYREGYPLGGYWDFPILGHNDANGDGIIEQAEVQVGTTPVWLGSAWPTQGASLSTGLRLWRGLRVAGLLEYRAGHVLLNGTAQRRCTLGVCPELYDRSTPLDRQAAAAAAWVTSAGYVEDGDYLKLRELRLSIDGPESLARGLGARRVSLSFVGRNVATWTGYSGFDPEVNSFAQSGDVPYSDLFTQPPVRSLIARLDLAF